MTRQSANIDHIRTKLSGKTGRSFWRALESLSEEHCLDDVLNSEFPSLNGTEMNRRSLLKAMAASFVLAGLSGCDGQADDDALPYVNAPESLTPGIPKWYATAVTFAGYAQPILGKTLDGRPIKLEGNPDHPASGGVTDVFTQAALLGLYDPDRSQSARHQDKPAPWSSFDRDFAAQRNKFDQNGGAGFRILTGAATSPTLLRQIHAILDRWPSARWHVWEPFDETSHRAASQQVFGRTLDQVLALERAEIIISFDDDLLGPGPYQTFYARSWSDRRRAFQNGNGDSRLFIAEPVPTATGAIAESRLAVAPGRTAILLGALAQALGLDVQRDPSLALHEQQWLDLIAQALTQKTERAVVTVGAQYPASLHALGILINERLGNFGQTIRFRTPLQAAPTADGSLAALVDDIHAGNVTSLAILETNPVYTAPHDLDFATALKSVELSLHAGLYADETGSACRWHLPIQHDLETWSDALAVDGTPVIMQPLIRPFYDVRSRHTLMAGFLGQSQSERDIVRATWREAWKDQFEDRWTEALRSGVADEAPTSSPVPEVVQRNVQLGEIDQTEDKLSVILKPDPTIWDGRYANNAWLQELPKPVTKITWGNTIQISPNLAGQHQLNVGDEVHLTIGDRSLTGPVWISAGQDDRTIGLNAGYGRRLGGHVGIGLGHNAFLIAEIATGLNSRNITLIRTGRHETIATTQKHQEMDGFDFVRSISRDELALLSENGGAAAEHHQASLYPDQIPDQPSWGMSIDLDTCIGCNACVVACMAENNIPVVGKDLVAQGREMHWLRIDHYYEGDPSAPKSHFQPVPCMHCEQAPCEMGCPVNASVHSSDGLNLQVYNRCIGTRTCSAYCPYKVRRFNWFDFTKNDPEQIRQLRNPDVTVRERGVMEKCTYCVQRISQARISAKTDGRDLKDGDVVTACQQVCPTRAIVFGNVMDPESAVSRRKSDHRNYSLLEEANTRPRTTYSARIESGTDTEEEPT